MVSGTAKKSERYLCFFWFFLIFSDFSWFFLFFSVLFWLFLIFSEGSLLHSLTAWFTDFDQKVKTQNGFIRSKWKLVAHKLTYFPAFPDFFCFILIFPENPWMVTSGHNGHLWPQWSLLATLQKAVFFWFFLIFLIPPIFLFLILFEAYFSFARNARRRSLEIGRNARNRSTSLETHAGVRLVLPAILFFSVFFWFFLFFSVSPRFSWFSRFSVFSDFFCFSDFFWLN